MASSSSTSSLKIESLLGMLTIRLSDDNYLKWSYQLESVLQGYDLFGHLDGSVTAPPKFAILDEEGVTSEVTTAYKDWLRTDKALLSLLIASLSDEALEYVIGSRTAREAWLNLTDRYASVSRARINHLKTEMQTAQKGGDSIERFLLRLKHIRDQLHSAGVKISDDDFVIAALNGLPPEYDIIKTVLIARDTSLSLKDFRAQLLVAEQTAEARVVTHSAMFTSQSVPRSASYGPSSGQGLLPTPVQGPVGYAGSNTRFPGPRPNFNGNYGRGNFGSGKSGSSQFRPSSAGFRNGFSTNKSAVPECQICSKRGHTAANCYHRHSSPNPAASSVIIECQICGKKGHGALDCYHRSNYAFQGQSPPSSLTAMTAQTSYNPDQVWIADSGATHHMVSNLDHLNNAAACDSAENVTVGNGEGLQIRHIGTAKLSSLTLPSVFHVPHLTANLLSVHQLCKDNNCNIIFDVSGFYIQDKLTKQILLQGKSSQGLYPIPVSLQSSAFVPSPIQHSQQSVSPSVAFLGQQVKSSLWHHRLGHPTNEVVKYMLKAAQLPYCDDSQFFVCSDCLHGKMHKLPFPTDHVKVTIPFQKIHSDVWGPSRMKSIDGFRFYVIFVDECTGYTWFYPLYNKSEVYATFLKFHAMLVTQFTASVKCLQSDGGGEFTSKLFTDYLASKGIEHQLSCPYTPQQNGLAERKNRHLIETSITLLTAAHLPSQFWFHATAHAAYLINRMPSKSLDLQSPYYRLFGLVPDITHVKVFGTAVYPYLRPYTEHKLQPRTTQCVFLGYAQGYKGVICYNPSTGKLVISRHVLHDETCHPFKRLPADVSQVLSMPSPSTSIRVPFLVSVPTSDIPNSVQGSENLASPHDHSVSVPTSDSAASEHSISPDTSPSLSHAVSPSDSIASVLNAHQLQVLVPAISASAINSSSVPEISAPSIPSGNTHHMQTRAKSGISKQNPFPDYQCYHTTIPVISAADEPSSYRMAAQSPAWVKAMQEELEALQMQGTWSLVPCPSQKNIVGSKWIYKIKRNADGSIARYKARLVAQGFSQQPGLDFSETFSPVVRHTTVRLILSLAAMNKWCLRQLDVKNAFLHGDLEEEVYMRQPPGFEDSKHPDFVCRLAKSLYGLKQAPRAWNAKFTGYLPALGFKSSHSDPSLFVKHEGSDIVILLLYVDDIILTGSSPQLVQTVIDDLGAVFDMKDMGRLAYFLGLQVSYGSTGGIFVHQTKYAQELLNKAGMTNCKACPTPCKPHNQVLQTAGQPLTDPTLYRSLVGALQYLTFTRPDLSYSVNTVCQYMTTPTEAHFDLVKRILRYIQGTIQYGIHFTTGPWHLQAYSDADWAGDLNTRRSTTGFVVFLGNNPISWQSKKQGSVSRSSTEAEYRALAHTAADLAWVRQVLLDLKVCLPEPPTISCDNLSALALSSNPIYHSRIKHLDIDFHFVRERVQRNDLTVQYIPTEEQLADVFTKGLHSPVFSSHCANMRLGNLELDLRGNDNSNS
ncbi:hypothetical protein ACE6H2_026429 [Prunus campanulata]